MIELVNRADNDLAVKSGKRGAVASLQRAINRRHALAKSYIKLAEGPNVAQARVAADKAEGMLNEIEQLTKTLKQIV